MKPGDVVMVRGGLKVTVENVFRRGFYALWFDGSTLHSERFDQSDIFMQVVDVPVWLHRRLVV
jgi:uncharacterized protein YodC (DUF2158 family)